MIKKLPERQKCIVAISFLNYQTAVGGMSKYIMAHEKMYREEGYSYICIYSVKKIYKKKIPLFYFYGVIIDGVNQGIVTIDDLLYFFYLMNEQGYIVNDVHIHNMLYMNLHHMIRLANTLPKTPFKLILHDFHTICTNFNLLKNGDHYCGDDGMSKEKCSDCKFYDSSSRFVEGVKLLIENVKYRLIVVAPSEVAKNIWLKSYPGFRENVVVVTEQIWKGNYLLNREQLPYNSSISIGYLGNKSRHKGWNVWQEFAKRANDNHTDFQFIVFNSQRDIDEEFMSHVPVRFRKENLNAMITALRENCVECVLLWSIWPETYSYTLFEACAANAFIITNPNSGNIAYVVKEFGNGIILNNEEELYYFAEHPKELIEKINEVRKNGPPGPENLIDNDKFLELTHIVKDYCVAYKKSKSLYRGYQKCLLSILKGLSRILKIRLQ